MDNLARSYQIEQELRGTIDMQDDIICKLVALNERLKAALAVADYDSSECRYCQHRGEAMECHEEVSSCAECPTTCCLVCKSGSHWALDLDKLPEVRT